LLGCRQFIPDVENDRTIGVRLRYGVGIPERAQKELDAKLERLRDPQPHITAFEKHDHTPLDMRKQFPAEYDFHTMFKMACDKMYDEYRKALLNLDAQTVWMHSELPGRMFPSKEEGLAALRAAQMPGQIVWR
jgi:hypothetical protein